MKKILLSFIALSIATGLYPQEVDMSQVTFKLNDWTKPYLAREIIDTIETCKAVKAELESIMSEGINAFNSSDHHGHDNFSHHFQKEIGVEQEALLSQYESEIKSLVVTEAEKEYQNLLQEATNLTQDMVRLYYNPRLGVDYEPTDALKRLIPVALEKVRKKWNVTMHVTVTGIPDMKKLSKSLQKELPKNRDKIIEELIPIVENKLISSKRAELRIPAENSILRNHIKKIIDRMPPVDTPDCFEYIHAYGSDYDKMDNTIQYLASRFFRDREALSQNKMKIGIWKNPYYYKYDNSWEWLTKEEIDEDGRKIERERVEKHYPIEDTYWIDRRHPEFQIRRMYVKTQNGREVNAAFVGDTLKGVSNEFAYANSYVDQEMEEVLCFYELEHNKHNINAQPSYVKDRIRYDLVTYEYSNSSYSYDGSFEYKKNHKYETIEMSEQYIKQLHLDHKDLGKWFYHKIDEFKYKRTERVDGITFRHYIGENEQIVILQKFVYGNYCWKLFPYSKVTSFNPQDYIINKNVYKKENKVLTCYYVVEKYE